MDFKSRWTYITARDPVINLKSFTPNVAGIITTKELYEAVVEGKSTSVSGKCREILCDYINDVKNISYFGTSRHGVVVLGEYTPDESIINKLNSLIGEVNSPILYVEDGLVCIRLNAYEWRIDEVLISSLIVLLEESEVLSNIKLMSKKETIRFLIEVFCDMVNFYSEEAENLAFSALYLAMYIKFSLILTPAGTGPMSYITGGISAMAFFKLKDLIKSNLSKEKMRELRDKVRHYGVLSYL